MDGFEELKALSPPETKVVFDWVLEQAHEASERAVERLEELRTRFPEVKDGAHHYHPWSHFPW